MKTPSGASAISHEWVEFVLQQHEAKAHPDVSVKLISYSVVAATKPGENFNSDLVRLEASAEVRRGEPNEDSSQLQKNDYSFIVKFLSFDPFIKELGKATNQHLKEFVIYSSLICELNSYWETNAISQDVDQRINVPDYIYGVCNSSEYVLVMENCKESKFDTNDKCKGLDLPQTLVAVEHIARLHALSRSYNLATDICEKYPCLTFSNTIANFLKYIGSTSLRIAEKYLKTLPEYKDISTKIEKEHHALMQKFETLWTQQNYHKMLCLAHGDLWNNNLLFRYYPVGEDGERSVETLKLIDWQNTQWNNPVTDLHYLLSTSISPKIRNDHLDEILHHYHSTFMRVSENVKTPVPDWSYDQFYEEFMRMSLVGLVLGLCLIQGTLSKAGEKLNANSSGSSSAQSKNSLTQKLKTRAAKIIVPITIKPSFQFIIKQGMKGMLAPIAQELIEGQNPVLNERFLGLILEADKRGLFDSVSI